MRYGSHSENALGLVEEVQQKGLEPDVITYSAAISACEKGQQWQCALRLLESVQ